MAVANIRFGGVMGGGAPVYQNNPRAEVINSTATSQQSVNSANANDTATIVAISGAVWVNVGDNPVAAAGARFLVPDGGAVDIGPLRQGERVAVIDA